MADIDVTREGAQPTGAGAQPQGGKGNEKVELTREQFEALNRELRETKQSERYWADRARQGGGGQPDQAQEPEEVIETEDLVPQVTGNAGVDKAIFEDPDKWAEAISKGPGAIDAFIRQAGYITGKEAADIARKVAERIVDVERGKMSTDAVIARDFPDLQNPQSELFQATKAELQKLVALDPSARNRPATLYAAANAAKARLDAQKPARRREDDEEDRYDRFDDEDRDRGRGQDDDDERDRRRRIDAQDGRSRTRDTDDRDSYLGPQAREVMSLMGVKEEDYLAEAKRLRGERPRGRR